MSKNNSAHARQNQPSNWKRFVRVVALLVMIGAGCMVGVLVYAATNLPVWVIILVLMKMPMRCSARPCLFQMS